MDFSRRKHLPFEEFIIFIISFFWYVHALFPAIYGGDTGELIVSAHILGIPHAPGYPLYNLLAKLIELIIPWGNPAYQINLLAALLGAITLVLCYKLIAALTSCKPAAFATAVFLMGMPIFFEQSLVSEVFMLNACIALALMCILVCPQVSDRQWYVVFFIFGLGLGNHHTLILLIPAVHLLIQPAKKHILFGIYLITFAVVFISVKAGFILYNLLIFLFYLRNRIPKIVWRRAIFCGLWMVAGLSIYAYLPIRAHADPAINFGNPDSLSALWAVITRREFGSFQLHPTALRVRSFAACWGQVLGYLATTVKNIGLIGLLISIAGIIAAYKKKYIFFLSLFFIIPGPIFVLFSNLSPNSLALWRLERFHLIPLIALAVYFGLGLSWLIRYMRSKIPLRPWHEYVFLGIILTMSMYPLRRFADSRADYYLRDFGNNLLATIAPGGSLILDTKLFDEYGSSLAYATLVQRKRSDIRLISRSGTMLGNIYGDDFQYLPDEQRHARILKKENELIQQSLHPIYYAAIDRNVLPDGEFRYAGLLNKLGRASIQFPTLYVRRDLSRGPAEITDYPTRLIQVHYPYFYGKAELEKGNTQLADDYFTSCMKYGNDMEWLMYNLGSLYSQEGNLRLSEQYFMRALEQDPFFPETYFGLGFVYYRNKQLTQAENAFLMVISLKSDFPDAYYNLGIIQLELGKKDSAEESWQTYLTFRQDTEQAKQIKDFFK
ncbi:MAG: DUF2723 domain-containing protein [bacterium]